MIFMDIFNVLKNGFFKTFDYKGKDNRLSYLTFLSFQASWFYSYVDFFTKYTDDIKWIPMLFFIMPLLASGCRRINDAGYSRCVFILLLLAPYLLFPFLIFPASVARK